MGNEFGYEDGYDDSGNFKYTGEGQIGDMSFVKGNRAIRDHSRDGKALHLFSTTRKAYVEYEGEFCCVDYEMFKSKDRTGAAREAIRFILAKVGDAGSSKSSTASFAPSPKGPNPTERQGLITSRVGQGRYRQELVKKFDGACAVTKIDLQEILIASHVVPWRDATDKERLDKHNGLLLSPVYDALFDKHLISFDGNGRIRVSSLLSASERSDLGISGEEKIALDEKMKPYMTRHLARLR